MKIVGIIPARYNSSRFPGKPLAEIHGKPMIWWVYQNAAKVKEFSEIIIATDDIRIMKTCKHLKMNVIMTNEHHKTGTDRICEIFSKFNADLYVNIQGDEPMLHSKIIKEAIKPFLINKNEYVTNLMTKITSDQELNNPTIPKVLVNRDNVGIYLTRSSAPYPKGEKNFNYYKQVCVYGFSPKALNFFCNSPRGFLEEIEDIEILRFIEARQKVQFIEVESNSIAVDTQIDLEKVKKMIKSKKVKNEKN